MFGILTLLVIISSIWVLVDASSHGIRKEHNVTWYQGGPIGWGLGSLLLWILVFPTYVSARSKLIAATAETASGGRMKRCPMCAEDVKADALICKHCRHSFTSA